MNDRSTRIMLAICTVISAASMANSVALGDSPFRIGMAVLLTAVIGAAMLSAFIFPSYPPGKAPGDGPCDLRDHGRGPYTVSVSWYDEAGACWRHHASWTGLADNCDDAAIRAVAETRQFHDEPLRGEVTVTPDAFEGSMNRRECAELEVHGLRRDDAGCCVYCGYQDAT